MAHLMESAYGRFSFIVPSCYSTHNRIGGLGFHLYYLCTAKVFI